MLFLSRKQGEKMTERINSSAWNLFLLLEFSSDEDRGLEAMEFICSVLSLSRSQLAHIHLDFPRLCLLLCLQLKGEFTPQTAKEAGRGRSTEGSVHKEGKLGDLETAIRPFFTGLNTKAHEVPIFGLGKRTQKRNSFHFKGQTLSLWAWQGQLLTVSLFQWRAGALACVTPHCSTAGRVGDSSPEILCLQCPREVTEEDFNTPPPAPNSRMGEKQIFERKEDMNNHSSEPLAETTAQAIVFAQLPDNRHQLPLLKGSPEERK